MTIPPTTAPPTAMPPPIAPTAPSPAAALRKVAKRARLTPPAPAAVAPPPPAQYRYDAFPGFPPRGDMQNTLHLHDQGHQAALRRHLGAPQTTVVIGEVPVAWNRDQRAGMRVPDLLVVFGVERAGVVREMGYSIEYHGKPPDFVLEIASVHTARKDETIKRNAYAAYGVREYWRFDPDWGVKYATGLAGDTLVNGAYQPISIRQADANRYWGHSAVLNLDICWEYGELRFYDPVGRRYLHTYDSADDGRITAEYARDAALDQRDAAIADRDREAAARNRETVARQAAEARIRELESRLAASES